MCGIAGSVALDLFGSPDSAPRVDVDRVRRMTARLAHRGPNGDGFFATPRAALGFRRLAILDLSPAANQPHVAGSLEAPIASVMNGEIWNHRELRAELERDGVRFKSRGDAEVVPHLYAKHGDRFLERLDGMFAIAIVDLRAGRLVLARDRLGKKPLCFVRRDRWIDFASEPGPLVAELNSVEPDAGALCAFLLRQSVPSDRSAFTGLERVPPAGLVVVERGAVRVRRWYRPAASEGVPRDAEEIAGGAFERLVDATRARLDADVPLGVFLSGGIDSGLVLAAAAAARGRAPLAFTIGFDDPRLDERDLARATAAHVGAELIERAAAPEPAAALADVVRRFDEPFGDPSAVPMLALSALAREHVTVALSGDGGDETFAGYRRYAAAARLARLQRIVPRALLALVARVAGATANGTSGRSALGEARRFLAAAALDPVDAGLFWNEWFRAPLRARFLHPEFRAAAGDGGDSAPPSDGSDVVDRLRRIDLDDYLPDDLLVKVDLASMGHALEVRCPFLDRRMVEFALGVDPARLIEGGRTKAILRRLAERHLPPQVANAAKRGFSVPLAAWLRGPLAPVAESMLASERFARRRILKDGAAAELLKRHRSGREDWSMYLWLLLVLEAWFRRHVDRDDDMVAA